MVERVERIERVVEVRQPGRVVLRVVLDGPLELGREVDGLLLADPKVSRRHVRLAPATAGIDATDLGSRNGIWVNGERRDQALVGPDDSLVVGDTLVIVRPAGPTRAATLAGEARALDPRSSIAAVLGAVDPGEIDARVSRAPDGTVTILFSDIEESTAQAAALGDHRWMELLAEHNAIVRGGVAEHHGTEVKTIGDGFMVTFTSARAGLAAAVAIQRALATRGARGPDWPVRVRVGLHTGEALREGDDVFGTHVNLAARVAGAAQGGEILVSGLLHDLVAPVADVPLGPPRELELKGLPGIHRVHPVEWRVRASAPEDDRPAP